MATELKLPELGENIEAGDVVRVLVSAGDRIEQDQPVVELETDKATIEVPSSVAGTVQDVKVKPGEKVRVGQVILTVDGGDGEAAASAPTVEQVHDETSAGAERSVSRAAESEQAAETAREEPEEPAPQQIEAPVSSREPERGGGGRRGEVVEMARVPRPAPEPARAAAEPEAARDVAPAAPSVRRLARELGIEISQVPGSGPGGRISTDDVIAHARSIITHAAAMPAAAGPAAAPALPDLSKWGEIERLPMRGIRRKTAENLSRAWTAIPHVTQYDKADVTELERLRERFAKRAEQAGGKLTVTAIAVKVVAAALQAFPQFNAAVDMAAEEIVQRKYINVGIAVDTERGLLVPVVRDVERKSIVEIAAEVSQLADRARNKKLTLEEMEGGGFTITNLGGIGGTYFSPIVNWPEVAILGLSRATLEPVYVDGRLEPRLKLPLSLSYDHRVIDGADAIRFLRWVAEALEQPFLLPLLGR